MLGLETSRCSFGPTDAHPAQTKTLAIIALINELTQLNS
jgi:hypothetical protein